MRSAITPHLLAEAYLMHQLHILRENADIAYNKTMPTFGECIECGINPEDVEALIDKLDAERQARLSAETRLDNAKTTLTMLASFKEGEVVNSSFDEPNAAVKARQCLFLIEQPFQCETPSPEQAND